MSRLAFAAMLQLASTPECTVPGMPPETTVAVAQQESGFHPHAIRDERTGRSYFLDSRDEALSLATRLTAEGHLLGVGLMQLTPPARFGLSVAQALDPCINMHHGAKLLSHLFSVSLRQTLSRYNSGHPTRSEGYARSVEAIAARMPPLASGGTAPLPAVPAPPPSPAAMSVTRGSAGRELVFARNP